MTDIRVSKRSDRDTGEARDGMSEATMVMAMEMATVVTLIAADTAGAGTLELIERHKNGKRRRRSEALATDFSPRDWSSRTE
jgi:adenylate kinase